MSNSLLIAHIRLILSFPEQGTNLQEAWRKLKGVQGERNSMSDESVSVFFVHRLISFVETLAMLEKARRELEEMRDTLVVAGNEEKSE